MSPRFFRSGYVAEKYLKRLKRARLSRDQADRQAEIVLRHVRQQRYDRIYRYFANLAVSIRSAEPFAELGRLSMSDDPIVSKKALDLLTRFANAQASSEI